MSYPESGKKVLIYCKPIDFCTGYYWGKKHSKEPTELCKGWSIMDVTHWMELPEKPK